VVNSQLVTGMLQHLCDKGGLRTAQGMLVPIVMTGNDFRAPRIIALPATSATLARAAQIRFCDGHGI
jgi:hypothetical protein